MRTKYAMELDHAALRRTEGLLRWARLPDRLVLWLLVGRVEQKIAEGYAQWERLTTLLDAWEEQNPLLAEQLPWAAGRAAWKAAGRPRPEWWEVLRYARGCQKMPLAMDEIMQDLLGNKQRERRARRARGSRQAARR